MSQLYEPSGAIALENDVRVTNMTRHRDQATPSNSPTSQNVLL